MITYKIGDCLASENFCWTKTNLICHICNNKGGWGKGFVLNLSRKWTKPEEVYRELWPYTLGTVQFVQTEAFHVIVANMIAQNGYGNTCVGYESLRKCLEAVYKFAIEHNIDYVHMPKIGTGLGGGDWNIIEKIIQEELVEKGIDVIVYTLP